MLRHYKRRCSILRKDQLGDEERVAQVRQVVVETLCRMDGAQRTEILLGVLANKHFSSTGFSLCSVGSSRVPIIWKYSTGVDQPRFGYVNLARLKLRSG